MSGIPSVTQDVNTQVNVPMFSLETAPLWRCPIRFHRGTPSKNRIWNSPHCSAATARAHIFPLTFASSYFRRKTLTFDLPEADPGYRSPDTLHPGLIQSVAFYSAPSPVRLAVPQPPKRRWSRVCLCLKKTRPGSKRCNRAHLSFNTWPLYIYLYIILIRGDLFLSLFIHCSLKKH